MATIDLELIPAGSVTRFAPSPTGVLHLGHVANAVWTWGVARAVGGRVVLRIEDHDRGRCRPQFERAILEDLAWLGLSPDDDSLRSLTAGRSPYRQSDNPDRYQAAFERLQATGRVYACDCSRKQIAAALGDPVEAGEERRYPGTCRDRGLEFGPGRGARVVLSPKEVRFTDARLGERMQRPSAQCGDLLLRDSTGNWTYQFSVVVDDLIHGIDLVIRGEDLVESTGRQILLADMLGRAAPARFLHHPLILAPSGAKLSKRDGAPGLDELRAGGMSPERVLGMAAHATGLAASDGPLPVGEFARLFSTAASD